MDQQQHKNTTLAETTTRIESIISREKTKIQLQASKLSMRFKSTTRWEVLTYPLVIPDSVGLRHAPKDWIIPKLTMTLTRLILQMPWSKTLPSQTSLKKFSSQSSQMRKKTKHSSLAP